MFDWFNGKLAVSMAFLTGAVVTFLFFVKKRKKFQNVCVGGQVAPGFEAVENAFRTNFALGWERDGAALAVFHRGRLVVDLWGGWADVEAERVWHKDTMNVAFSSTKAVAAVCVGVLVDRGFLQFETRLAEFWPEFGQNGKESITVEMVLTHTAGLALIEAPILYEDAMNPARMATLLEQQRPHWSPGTKVGYHANSFAWLVDQIVRRTDPLKRGIGKFLWEEVCRPHNLDFHIGLPLALAHRVSRLRAPSVWQRLAELWQDPDSVNWSHLVREVWRGGLLTRIGKNLPWLKTFSKMTLNNPNIYIVEHAGALGIGTARSLAQLFQLFLEGKIVSAATVQRMSEPVVTAFDIVTGAIVPRGLGFTFAFEQLAQEKFALAGHAGFGGQNVRFDREHELTFAYLSNGLKNGFGDRARTYVPLKNAILASVVAISAGEK